MLTLVDTHHIEALIAENGNQVVDDAYLRILTIKAKEKLILSRERFEKLRQELQLKLS